MKDIQDSSQGKNYTTAGLSTENSQLHPGQISAIDEKIQAPSQKDVAALELH